MVFMDVLGSLRRLKNFRDVSGGLKGVLGGFMVFQSCRDFWGVLEMSQGSRKGSFVLCMKVRGISKAFQGVSEAFQGIHRASSNFERFSGGFRGSQVVSETFNEVSVGFRGVLEALLGISKILWGGGFIECQRA